MFIWMMSWLHPERIQWLINWSRFVFVGCLIFLIPGLWGAWVVPADYQQGDSFRIIFCHVPAAILSLFCYVVLTAASAIFLVWRVKYYDYVAICAAEAGTLMCALALTTGMIWGKPIWGTYWIWDARLTSTALLLAIYCIYHMIRHSVTSRELERIVAAAFALVGCVDIPLIHYSVYWWQSLHQGSTFFQAQQQAIPLEMAWPMWLVLIGLFGFLGYVGSWRFETLFLLDMQRRRLARMPSV